MGIDAVGGCEKTNPIQTQFAQWANDRTQGPLQSKIMQNKANFLMTCINVNPYSKMAYGDIRRRRLRENKAKQSQWPAIGWKLEALRRESQGRGTKFETNSPFSAFSANSTVNEKCKTKPICPRPILA